MFRYRAFELNPLTKADALLSAPRESTFPKSVRSANPLTKADALLSALRGSTFPKSVRSVNPLTKADALLSALKGSTFPKSARSANRESADVQSAKWIKKEFIQLIDGKGRHPKFLQNKS